MGPITVYSLSHVLWEHNSVIREAWLHETKGKPRFHIVPDRESVFRVVFAGRDKTPPDIPPQSFIYEIIAREAYSEPLLMEPLPDLDGRNVLELLRVQFMLSSVLEQVIEEHLLETRDTAETALEFCPLILLEPLASALSKALRVSTEAVVTLVDALTVSNNTIDSRSIWFHPLVRTRTKKGDAVMPAFLPLLSANVYRDVDYWLAKFGLPLKRRGRLFEQQLADSLRLAAQDSEMRDHVVVRNSVELTSEEGSSSEEIDLVLLLDDLVVVGEAKCMKLPVTPVERKNYLETLRGAAAQATRKAAWAERNLSSVAQVLDVAVDRLSELVQPVVISNHSPGVGCELEVPVVDLRLITNYLARPYNSVAIYSSTGYTESKGSSFYNTPEEMARNFKGYIEAPPPLETHRALLKPELVQLPLRSTEQVLFLAYSMDHSIMTNPVAQPKSD